MLLYTREAERLRETLRDVLGWDSVEGHDPPDGWLIFKLPPAELGVSVANGNAGEWVLVVESGTRTFALEVDAIGELIDVRDRDIRDGTIQLRMNGRPYGRVKTLFDPDDL